MDEEDTTLLAEQGAAAMGPDISEELRLEQLLREEAGLPKSIFTFF